MSQKHTPGPWSLCAHLEDGDKCSCGYRGVIWGPDSKAVCQPGHEPAPSGQEGTEPPRYPREVEFANSRLIAAAPTMFEYIAHKASAGEAEALQIMEVVRGNA